MSVCKERAVIANLKVRLEVPHTLTKKLSFSGNSRLSGGHNRCVGRVEYYDKGQWGTVCGGSWDMNDATVLCRQLDCGLSYKITTMAEYGSSTGQTWTELIECSGLESTLAQCQRSMFIDENCNSTTIAGVVCTGKKIYQKLQRIKQSCLLMLSSIPFFLFSLCHLVLPKHI